MQNELPASLRPKLAAKAMGVSPSTLLRWEHERPDFPPPRRLSTRVTVYDRDRLLAWRDAQGVAA